MFQRAVTTVWNNLWADCTVLSVKPDGTVRIITTRVYLSCNFISQELIAPRTCTYTGMCVCMIVCMYVCFFMYIIKYAPSPGRVTTYYNVSSYTFLFMGMGCRVCLCSRRPTLHSLYNVSFNWYLLALVVYTFTTIVCHNLLSS